ncbi:TPA: hypothetical protein KOX39_003422 [Clostridioides difficile]|nr:hypothetical protein [Clostridioides difficile]
MIKKLVEMLKRGSFKKTAPVSRNVAKRSETLSRYLDGGDISDILDAFDNN